MKGDSTEGERGRQKEDGARKEASIGKEKEKRKGKGSGANEVGADALPAHASVARSAGGGDGGEAAGPSLNVVSKAAVESILALVGPGWARLGSAASSFSSERGRLPRAPETARAAGTTRLGRSAAGEAAERPWTIPDAALNSSEAIRAASLAATPEPSRSAALPCTAARTSLRARMVTCW